MDSRFNGEPEDTTELAEAEYWADIYSEFVKGLRRAAEEGSKSPGVTARLEATEGRRGWWVERCDALRRERATTG